MIEANTNNRPDRVFFVAKSRNLFRKENDGIVYHLYEDSHSELPLKDRVHEFTGGSCWSGFSISPEDVAKRIYSSLKDGDKIIFRIIVENNLYFYDGTIDIEKDEGIRLSKKLGQLIFEENLLDSID